jgi:hypothetical protein
MTPREPLELTLGLRCGTSSADASLEREEGEERRRRERRERREERDQVQLYSVS